MPLSFSFFCEQISKTPLLILPISLTLGSILVNGWTDAPNAIATCVSTRCLSLRSAISLAAIFNLFGILIMTALTPSVAQTITKMVDISSDTDTSMLALSAALLSIVIWGVAALRLGLPTSESHALIAGLTGSAVAVHEGFDGINSYEWLKVIYGLLLSLSLGFSLGIIVSRLTLRVFAKSKRYIAEKIFRIAQIVGAAASSFMHGAQDGQKFMGIIILSIYLSGGSMPSESTAIPIWLMIVCALFMALGTSIGGKGIIRSVGMEMVKLEKFQGFSSDIAASLSLLCASLLGMPVSTTHVKSTAMIGAGAAKSPSSVNPFKIKELVLAWVLTFPACTVIGFLVTKLFLFLFI